MWRAFTVLAVFIIVGCGPSSNELREQTLSVLNTEADRWDGGEEFVTNATDSYGHPLIAKVEHPIPGHYHTLELRSAGPDGLPKNSDVIVVYRSKWR